MFICKGTDILINSADAAINITKLKTISNIQIPAHCIATIPTKLTGKLLLVLHLY